MTALASGSLALLALCITAEAARELCFKQAASGRNLRQALLNPILGLGIVIWLIEMAAWILVLERVPLSLAFPLMALVYVVIVLGGALFFKEKIGVRHAAGALSITAGVAWIGVTGL